MDRETHILDLEKTVGDCGDPHSHCPRQLAVAVIGSLSFSKKRNHRVVPFLFGICQGVRKKTGITQLWSRIRTEACAKYEPIKKARLFSLALICFRG